MCRTTCGQQGLVPPSTFSPDELFAVEAEGGLTQEGGHELMAVDLVDLASYSTLPLSRELFVGFLFHRGLVWQGKKRTDLRERNPASRDSLGTGQRWPSLCLQY